MAKHNKARLVQSAKQFIESNIVVQFHDRLLDGLIKLKLNDLLRRKNPYLFKAKAIQQAHKLITRLLDAFLSSKEETIFGRFLESLAIHINSKAYGGKKSTSKGIDLEFERDGHRHIVSIKSGPNWGNSSQIENMEKKFSQARKIAESMSIVAIDGCCYGNKPAVNRGNYRKLCGQDFWEFITGIDSFYQEIVEPLGFEAKLRTDLFDQKYNTVVNLFSKDFIDRFCLPDGTINWEELVAFNSSRK